MKYNLILNYILGGCQNGMQTEYSENIIFDSNSPMNVFRGGAI